MREIKFRAQAIASNKWFYGDLRHHKDDVCIFEQGGNKGEIVKRDTIGQYTGLHDKNGKEIYEGDIIALKDSLLPSDDREKDYIGPVIYDERDVIGVFYMKLFVRGEGFDTFLTALFFLVNMERVEVVGNIHDNPELLS